MVKEITGSCTLMGDQLWVEKGHGTLLKFPIPLGKQQDGVLGLGPERSLLETPYLT